MKDPVELANELQNGAIQNVAAAQILINVLKKPESETDWDRRETLENLDAVVEAARVELNDIERRLRDPAP